MHRQNIDYIIKHGTDEQMEELKDVLEEAVDMLKSVSRSSYNKIEYCLHKVAHGHALGEDVAKHWVKHMNNKDGTKGEHWTWDQVAQIYKERKIGADVGELYAVLNMMYSDYYNPKFDTAVYIDMAKDWIADADIGACKTLKYYYYIVHE